MAVGTWEQVVTALGRPTSTFTVEQRAQLRWWLDGVELVIKDRLGEVSGLDQAVLAYVEVEVVAQKANRHLIPETSITTSVDDGSVTRRYEYPATAGDISDAQWALLSPAADSGGAFTIRPGGPRPRALDAEWPCW